MDPGRAEANPVVKITPLNAEPDSKRERQVLDDKEFVGLIVAPLNGHRLQGPNAAGSGGALRDVRRGAGRS